jgi:hypothetical protein
LPFEFFSKDNTKKRACQQSCTQERRFFTNKPVQNTELLLNRLQLFIFVGVCMSRIEFGQAIFLIILIVIFLKLAGIMLSRGLLFSVWCI